MAGLTLDTGALIGVERDDRRVLAHLKAALLDGLDVTVPAVVVTEAWRGGPRSARIARLLAACEVDPVDEPLARTAGEAVAAAGATAVDAIVMASAAKRGDAVLTSDPDDLTQLGLCFPNVRVLPIR